MLNFLRDYCQLVFYTKITVNDIAIVSSLQKAVFEKLVSSFLCVVIFSVGSKFFPYKLNAGMSPYELDQFIS